MSTPEIITPEQVDHVAQLAGVDLSAEEREVFARQLSDVLGYGAEMNALELDGIPPTTQPIHQGNVWRDDVPASTCDRSETLTEAPDSEIGYFKVRQD